MHSSESLVNHSQNNGLCSPWSLGNYASTRGLDTSTGSCTDIEPYQDRTTLSTIPIFNGFGAVVWPITCLAHNTYPSECLLNWSQNNGLCSPWSLGDLLPLEDWTIPQTLAPTWGLHNSTGSCPNKTYRDRTLSTIPNDIQWFWGWSMACNLSCQLYEPWGMFNESLISRIQ